MLQQHVRRAIKDPQGFARSLLRAARRLKWSWRDVSEAALSLENRDRPAAIGLHRALLGVSPADPLLQFRLGACLLGSGEADEALPLLAQAAASGSSQAALPLARAAFSLLSPEEAVKTLDATKGADGDWPANVARIAAAELLHRQRFDLADARCRRAFGESCANITRRDDVTGVYSVILAFDEGRYSLGFSRDFLYWPFLVERILTLAPHIDRLCRETAPSGEVRLSIGDGPDGDEPQLCFAGKTRDHYLIPDPSFLESNGYQSYKRAIGEAASAPWEERDNRAYWRGSLTGVAYGYRDIVRLPRVTLALMALHHPRIDAKITDLSQFGPLLPTLEFLLKGLGTIGPREDPIRNVHYRYLVDVDGNTNSWPGLFMKLSAGGVVVKLESEFRQWYYDRLRPDENFISVKSLDDILPRLDRLDADPQSAGAIAKAGAALARSMTPRSEYPHFRSAVLAALAR